MRRIAYSDWINYIKAAKEKGINCSEFVDLKNSDPIVSGMGSELLVQKEIKKLAVELIYSAIDGFEKSVNRSLEEADLFVFEKGLREFKSAIKDFMFFDNLESISKEIKDNIKSQVATNLIMFVDEFSKYTKRLSEYDNTAYVDEFMYIYKKANVKKFIQETVSYE